METIFTLEPLPAPKLRTVKGRTERQTIAYRYRDKAYTRGKHSPIAGAKGNQKLPKKAAAALGIKTVREGLLKLRPSLRAMMRFLDSPTLDALLEKYGRTGTQCWQIDHRKAIRILNHHDPADMASGFNIANVRLRIAARNKRQKMGAAYRSHGTVGQKGGRMTDNYLQCPLSLLSMLEPPYVICDHIISYGVVNAGIKPMEALDDDDREEQCDEFGITDSKSNDLILAAHLGAKICGVTLGSARGSVDRYKQAAAWEEANGGGIQVRLRKDLVFEARDGGQFSWRELRVLAGIYSVIGKKEIPVIIPQSMIEARHCGFSNQENFQRACSKAKSPVPLTPKQLRTTINRLWELKFFARVTPDPHGRATYYSHRMTDDQMREAIFKNRTYKAQFHQDQNAKNKALGDRIKAITTKPLLKVPFRGPFVEATAKGKAGAPSGQHEGTGEGTVMGTVRAPLIKTQE